MREEHGNAKTLGDEFMGKKKSLALGSTGGQVRQNDDRIKSRTLLRHFKPPLSRVSNLAHCSKVNTRTAGSDVKTEVRAVP